ncbi:MAG: energy transducer TonB [Bacteroidetes bacterium]|nr:energy transducer TonB [Bacteroidota bacterium]
MGHLNAIPGMALLAALTLQGVAYSSRGVQGKSYYVDANYRKVNTKRNASYRIEISELRDTVYFSTFSLRPKGLTEIGKYPRKRGFDQRNCDVQMMWPNGKVRAKGQRVNSYPEGLWTYFDMDGKPYSRVFYIRGQASGWCERLYSNGTRRIYRYQNGQKEGTAVWLNESGDTMETVQYTADLLHGTKVVYNDSHVMVQKTTYFYGLKQSDSIFYKGKKPCLVEHFDSSGKYHGRSMLFSSSGKILRFDEFNHGEEVQNACLHPIKMSDWHDGDCFPRRTEPRFPGGERRYETFIHENQDYPELAQTWRVQGVVEITVHIDAEGKLADMQEENLIPAGFGLDEEAMRLLKLIPAFEPMELNGEPRKSEKQFLFAFIL